LGFRDNSPNMLAEEVLIV